MASEFVGRRNGQKASGKEFWPQGRLQDHSSRARLGEHRTELVLTASLFVLGVGVLLLSRPGLPWNAATLISSVAIPALMMIFLFGYVSRWQSREARDPKSLRIVAILILVSVFLCRTSLSLADIIHAGFPAVSFSSLEYAMPMALAGMLLSLIFHVRMAFAGSLATIIIVCLLSANPFSLFLVSFSGSLAGISALRDPHKRASFLKAGCYAGAANMGAILILALFQQRVVSLPYDLLCGAIGGVVVGILSLGLLPSLEYLFDVTTSYKLLELSNLHQPILRQLILVAPGTYHHSIVLGTLAEAAAEAIGANSLLVRVSAYYHDIGKIRKPAYFIENQRGYNPHDRLSPSMSSLILVSHVKEGVELARHHRLPLPIVDIIRQHHGTCLITFFYQRAREAAQTGGMMQGAREEDYRYGGPKPQTKEAAIVMLADAVEAASKALHEPTPARIQGIVQRIINNIFVDGQLEECDLTLRDLHDIAKAFVRILTGIYHHRVQHPGFLLGATGQKGESSGDLDRESPKGNKNRYGPAERGRSSDIRRLGSSRG